MECENEQEGLSFCQTPLEGYDGFKFYKWNRIRTAFLTLKARIVLAPCNLQMSRCAWALLVRVDLRTTSNQGHQQTPTSFDAQPGISQQETIT